jgi:Tol biopolymer transport system component
MLKLLIALAVLLLSSTSATPTGGSVAPAFPSAAVNQVETAIVPRNPRIASMQKIQGAGARPKWAATGAQFVFDRRNADGLYDLYVADQQGSIVASLTDGRPVAPRHAGNGIYRPQGDFVVFVAQVASHFLDFLSPYGQVPMGEPGVGLFNNLWATNGINYWRLTDVPIKTTVDDGIPAIGTVNPHFSWDGSTLIWTERYAEGGNNNWGRWRLKAADFVTGTPGPRLERERVLFTPAVGTYVTAMEFLGPDLLLVAGNLSGQHEYFMDLYLLHVPSGVVQNLTNSPDAWEEGACVAPSGRIVYMTNRDSRYPLDTTRDWAGQPVEREYWVMNADGSGKERLTYFNDPTAPEYLGWRSVPIICGFSPDGKTMIGTVGRDVGDETRAFVMWQLWMIRFVDPL